MREGGATGVEFGDPTVGADDDQGEVVIVGLDDVERVSQGVNRRPGARGDDRVDLRVERGVLRLRRGVHGEPADDERDDQGQGDEEEGETK